MKKISSLTALGFLTLLVSSPLLAISRDWKSYILMVLGLVIVFLSLSIRKELHQVLKVIHGEDKETIKDTYVENKP